MHNCRETKERLTELVLDDAVLPAELGQCNECRAEFEALNATLRVTARLRETVAPSEDYWIDYHARLREKLFHAKAQRSKGDFAPLFAPLRLCVNLLVRLLKSSVPVPVPLAVAAIILLVVIATRQSPAPNPVVVQVPVEVPVIQEKTVTQVVYREKRPTPKPSKRASIAPTSENTFANLTGFKPTDEVKLTVIKGGVPNEE
jgi:hypothetical protein